MKIISKFKDYYDAVFYSGQGDLFVRNRSIQGIKISYELFNLMHSIDSYFENIKNFNRKRGDYTFLILFFCGEMYIIESGGIYNNKELDKLSLNIYPYKQVLENINKKYVFSKISINENEFEKLHVALNSPIVIYNSAYAGRLLYHKKNDPVDFIVNAKLSDFHFGQVYNSDQAHQMIEMYISNFLFKKDNTTVPVGDDKTRIVSAGFDLKTSFRKAKK